MKPQRLLLAIGLAGVGLLLNSCVDTKNPLSDPEKAKADPQLFGVWRRATDNGGAEYYHVGLAGGKLPPGMMQAISVTHNKDGSLARGEDMPIFSTTIGENHYLNVVGIDEKNRDQFEKKGWQAGLVEGYWLLKYRVKGDSLSVWEIDRDVKRRLITAGKIKGTIEENPAFFTDTTEKLASLLASPEGAELFKKEPVRYQRVK